MQVESKYYEGGIKGGEDVKVMTQMFVIGVGWRCVHLAVNR